MLEATIRVPATRGRMGSTEYYTATLAFGSVVKLFTYDPDEMRELPPEDRHQRLLKADRIPDIARYILDHDDYVFSSITVSVDAGTIRFHAVEVDADIGMLELPLEAKYIVNDGQHRVAGIAAALRDDPSLKHDTISVVILPDGGLQRSQQVFSDLNRTVHKTSKSLDILFDHRLPSYRITLAAIERVPLFRGRIDKERVSLSVSSRKFATLSGLQSSTDALLGSLAESTPPDVEERELAFTIEYWKELTDIVVPWSDIASGDVGPHDARRRYVSSYALSLWALGALGRAARRAEADGGDSWRTIVKRLVDVDWKKSNPDWQGRCMQGDDVITRSPTRRAMADYLQWAVGLAKDPPPRILPARV
jgi:DNA sulfur modification protein DndB